MLIFENSIPTERNKIKHKTPSTHCGPIFILEISFGSLFKPKNRNLKKITDMKVYGSLYKECLLKWKIKGAFHSTKIFGNPGSKPNGTDISRKFVSKISVHLSRLSFFLEIWKFRKFPVPLGISTRYESVPVPLAVKIYKMAASLSGRHYTGCKIMCHSSSLFLIAY